MTVLAASLGKASWYLTRGTGVVSLLLFTAVMVLGILGQQRVSIGERWPRFALDTLHREISLLAVAVLVVHILTSVLDGFAPITLLNAVIPFGASYRPLWLGLGALAIDLMLAVIITSLVRRRLGYGAWRTVHWLAYLSWPVAVLHGLGTGTDAKEWWMLGLTAICIAAVAGTALVRVARESALTPGRRTTGFGVTIAVCLGIALFALAGPLQPHWAKRAGTPAALLGAGSGTTVRTATVRAAGSTAAGAQSVPFAANLQGTLKRTNRPGGQVLDFLLTVSGGAHGELRIRLAGKPVGGGGVSMVGSQVDLAVAGLPTAAEGRVVALDGGNLAARVRSSSGTLDLRIALGTGPGDQISGQLQVDRAAG